MKKYLILLFFLICFYGYGQTVIDPGLGATTTRVNDAIQGCISLSGTDTYTGTRAGITYTSDYAYDVKFVNGNTGTSPTINLSSDGSTFLGAKSIRKYSAGSLVSVAANDLKGTMRLRYDGTFFVLDGIGNIGSGGGSGVSTVSVVTANGVSGSVANPTTTPAISLTLGAITPTTVNGVTLSGSSTPTLAVTGTTTVSGTHSGTSSGTNTGDQTSVTGNAGTATALQTTRTINGTSFDGTANVTVTAAAGTLTGATLNSTVTTSSLTSFGSTPTIVTPSITTGFTVGGAATSRKIIVGNGTNFVPSTETWAVPGTTGNVLTSNGTNWISTAPASGVFTTPEAFGAVGDGSTNDQAALQSCMNAGIPCALGPHNYRTNTAVTISTDNSFVYGYGNSSIISTTSNISAILITSKQNRLQDFEILGNSTGAAQRGIDVTGNAGLTLDYTFNQLNNIYFKNINHAGLYVTLVVGTTGSTHQGAIQAQACKAEGCGIGFFFDTRGEYNLLNNCISYACTVAGYKVIGGNNMWVGGKITDTNSGASPGVILATEAANDAHGVITGAEINHNSTGVTATSIVNGFTFNACHFYNNGSLSITSSANIKFWSCTFSSTVFTIVSSPTIGFYNCRFVDTPTITLTGTTPQWFNNTFDAGVIPKTVINQMAGPLVLTGGSPTALTASTEYPSINNNYAQTQQFATGNFSLQRAFIDQSPTWTAVGASVITDYVGREIIAPIISTNLTGTNVHGLRIPSVAVGSGVTNSYGATINAMTAATNNFTAQFVGGSGVKLPHLIGNTSAPSIAAGAGAGTSPTVVLTNATDLSGILDITTGTTPAGTNAVISTITFNTAYGQAPNIQLTPANANAAGLAAALTMVFCTSTTTTFVLNSGTTGLTGATQYKWFYHADQ